jgi:quercetin 2,3-dioxygenase
MAMPTIDIRRAETRFHTDIGWLDSHHCFSFGNHYDPENVGHGQLIVLNDDIVAPGEGFGTHGHRDMEIVTWVLSGELEHRDSTGTFGVIYPGLAQRMSAGSGIRHSEMNHSTSDPVHFVQMWVVPDTEGIEPGYEQLDVSYRLGVGRGLVAVASGQGHDGAVKIHQLGAVMWVARLAAGEVVNMPEAPFVHLYVASGSVHILQTNFDAGDAVRFTGPPGVSVTATAPTEIIVWETSART